MLHVILHVVHYLQQQLQLHRTASRKGTPVDLPPSPCLFPLPGRHWPAFLLIRRCGKPNHAKTRKASRGVKEERRSRRSIQWASRRPSDCRRAAGSSGPRCPFQRGSGPAEEQAERRAARTARSRSDLPRGGRPLRPWREGASFVFNALFPLFALYAPSKQSREARPCVFSMQCLLLE